MTKDALQFAVHREKVFAARALMEGIDVLCNDKKFFLIMVFELLKCEMRGVGVYVFHEAAKAVEKGVHAPRVAAQSFVCCDVFDATSVPETVGATEDGHARFRRNARARKNDDFFEFRRHSL